MAIRFFYSNENVLELDSGDGFTTRKTIEFLHFKRVNFIVAKTERPWQRRKTFLPFFQHTLLSVCYTLGLPLVIVIR